MHWLSMWLKNASSGNKNLSNTELSKKFDVEQDLSLSKWYRGIFNTIVWSQQNPCHLTNDLPTLSEFPHQELSSHIPLLLDHCQFHATICLHTGYPNNRVYQKPKYLLIIWKPKSKKQAHACRHESKQQLPVAIRFTKYPQIM